VGSFIGDTAVPTRKLLKKQLKEESRKGRIVSNEQMQFDPDLEKDSLRDKGIGKMKNVPLLEDGSRKIKGRRSITKPRIIR